MNTVACKNCGEEIEISAALQGQIEAQVLAAEHKKHEAALEKVRTDAELRAKKYAEEASRQATRQLEAEKESLAQRAALDLQIERDKLAAQAEMAQKKQSSEQEAKMRALQENSESAAAQNAKLREELAELMKSLRVEKEARANAELEAEKRVGVMADQIRAETLKSADERYHLKIAEQEKKLADTQKALEDAQRKAAQGSQQNQGEVLELDLENRLRDEFPYDEITEIKKGQRGADIVQTVRNQMAVACGTILWETKNGKWQPAWVAKFKADIREANANIGVIVSQETPTDVGDMKHLEGNVWVVTPRLASRLAVALRATVLQVDAANKMAAGKDAKMEALYQFLVGPEFRHRVEAIVENYSLLQTEIEKEKRAAALRWAHQEKAIRAVIDNTIGMYGDLQGITNRALPVIKTLELDEGNDEEEAGATQPGLGL